MASMAPHESAATARDDMTQCDAARTSVGAGDGDNQSAIGLADDSVSEEDSALPSLEGMEELILEAYNNMQSDGEHIFLPTDVASKLHHIAQLVKSAGYACDDIEPDAESNQVEAASVPAERELPSDAVVPSATSPSLSSTISPAIPSTHEQELQHLSSLHLSSSSDRVVETDDGIKAAKEGGEQRWGNNQENEVEPSAHEVEVEPMPLINEMPEIAHLPTVEEVNEDALSVSDLQSTQEEVLEQPPVVVKPEPPAAVPEKPVSRLRQPEIKRKASPPARPSSNTKLASSMKIPSAPSSRPSLQASRIKTDSSPPSKDRSSSTTLTYEQRREAAQKLRDDKANRELQARESARKQREDARKKIEEAHQKELAAKRERVARLKMLKDQRKAPPSKPSAIR